MAIDDNHVGRPAITTSSTCTLDQIYETPWSSEEDDASDMGVVEPLDEGRHSDQHSSHIAILPLADGPHPGSLIVNI